MTMKVTKWATVHDCWVDKMCNVLNIINYEFVHFKQTIVTVYIGYISYGPKQQCPYNNVSIVSYSTYLSLSFGKRKNDKFRFFWLLFEQFMAEQNWTIITSIISSTLTADDAKLTERSDTYREGCVSLQPITLLRSSGWPSFRACGPTGS